MVIQTRLALGGGTPVLRFQNVDPDGITWLAINQSLMRVYVFFDGFVERVCLGEDCEKELVLLGLFKITGV